jgi:hypothetical protein
MNRATTFTSAEAMMERFVINLFKRSIRGAGLNPKNLKGNWSEASVILEARLGKVTRIAEENKPRLVTLYSIAIDEVKANRN